MASACPPPQEDDATARPTVRVTLGRALLFVVAALAGTAALMGPALLNGYPLVYPDSYSYILASTRFYDPWRPIGYAPFISTARSWLHPTF